MRSAKQDLIVGGILGVIVALAVVIWAMLAPAPALAERVKPSPPTPPVLSPAFAAPLPQTTMPPPDILLSCRQELQP